MQLLALNKRPDAVYLTEDHAAFGALQVLNETNIHILNEIALVGFGNEPFTGMVTPTIKSIDQFCKEIGKKAAETFLSYVDKAMLNKLILILN